jgi:hypothetical protein
MMKKGDGNRPPRPTASLIFFVAALMLPSLREAGPIYQEAEKTRAALQHEVTVTLKLIQVTVTDKKGNPVSDLHKDEFVLYDNGKRPNSNCMSSGSPPLIKRLPKSKWSRRRLPRPGF